MLLPPQSAGTSAGCATLHFISDSSNVTTTAIDALPVRVIRPQSGWIPLDLAELWQFRELLIFLVWRDVKVRYKQTVLGAAWAILQPLLSTAIFTLVFGRLAQMPSDGAPYPLFIFTALLPWTFFANAIASSANSLVGNANLISKVYFPRLLSPISSVGVGLVDLGVASLVMAGLFAIYRVLPTPSALFAPLFLLLIVVNAIGVGALLSALTVSYRDFRYVIPFLVQLWMYASPVVYPMSLIPEKYRLLAALNPMAGLLDGFRRSLLGQSIRWDLAAVSTTVTVAVLLAGLLYFRRVERRFVDVI